MIDPSTEFGARVERRLHGETVGWLTTVDPGGTPQPIPVWFLRDGDTLLLYSKPGTPKLRNLEANPRVALNLDGDGRGGDIVVFTGEAAVSDDPPADRVQRYVDKYRESMQRIGMTPAEFAAAYSVPLRLRLEKLRGH